MGIWRVKCTRCGHEDVQKRNGESCSACRIGHVAKLEYLPDEYLNELRGRGYRTKLKQLQRMLVNGQINRVQYLAFKNDLDRLFPNPKVMWNRLPASFKNIHDLDDYPDRPAVTIHVPDVRAVGNEVRISTKEIGLLDKDGKPIWSKVAALRAKSAELYKKGLAKMAKKK